MTVGPRLVGRRVCGGVVLAVGLALSGCASDVTRERIESDVPISFANAYRLSQELSGRGGPAPTVTTTECHQVTTPLEDSGPGVWQCDLSYRLVGPGGGTPSPTVAATPDPTATPLNPDGSTPLSLSVTVDNLGCYSAVDGADRENTIVDVDSGGTLIDPKVAFEGCFDVYDDKTSSQGASPTP